MSEQWHQRDQNPLVIDDADGDLVAFVEGALSNPQRAYGRARLIAAAPELLAALRDLYKYARRWPADDGSVFHVRLEAAAAAIAKAEGRE